MTDPGVKHDAAEKGREAVRTRFSWRKMPSTG
jgi:hypothetical protein